MVPSGGALDPGAVDLRHTHDIVFRVVGSSSTRTTLGAGPGALNAGGKGEFRCRIVGRPGNRGTSPTTHAHLTLFVPRKIGERDVFRCAIFVHDVKVVSWLVLRSVIAGD